MKHSSKVQRQCKECKGKFTIFRAWLRNGKAGKYCSVSCGSRGHSKEFPRRNRIIKKCQYCNKDYEIKPYREKESKYCSRKCFHSNSCGENHPNWKGGISERPKEYKIWAKKVKKRDKCCIICNSTDDLHAHHIKDWKNNPLLRYDLNNGETLCGNHHAEKHPTLSNMLKKIKTHSGIYKLCEICKLSYYVRPYKINTSRFCSHQCLWRATALGKNKPPITQ